MGNDNDLIIRNNSRKEQTTWSLVGTDNNDKSDLAMTDKDSRQKKDWS